MRFRCLRPVGTHAGFTLLELMAAVAVIGVITVLATPVFLSFLRAQELRGAAGQVAALLQQARQLAIASSTSYRVEVDVTANRLRFVRTSDDTPWTGPGAGSQGYWQLENQSQITAVTANPTFNPLGTAGGGTITVAAAQGSQTLNVVVSSSGRVRIQ
ncbi:MAG: GspH/FimT family pseudopilin [Candidatus Methylomirabilia bacterium]